ncbi:hypothetical protein GA0074695_2450 [Micromonospora viridifaciens]|uniref:Uncharacterized protein n=1 Tax=Micromonospora viridifaciens TaxID=1881 RepID=A0A1C4WHK4_MICVI|nr:hypothetical protein GA0074695_2450 [Micromonospora viridifaciens]
MTGDLIGRLRHAVGPSGVISDPDEMAGYLTDWRNVYAGPRPSCGHRPIRDRDMTASAPIRSLPKVRQLLGNRRVTQRGVGAELEYVHGLG